MSTVRNYCSNIASATENFVSNQVGARIGHLLSGVEQTANNLTDLFKGSVYACTSCLGFRSTSLKTARTSLHDGGEIVARIYTACLRCINPRARITYLNNYDPLEKTRKEPPRTQFYDQITRSFNQRLEMINALSLNQKWVTRNVTARAHYVGLAVFSVMSRSKMAVIGIAALPLSLTSAALSVFTEKASFPKLHGAAQHGLLAPLVIHDLFTCAIGLIYPRNLVPVENWS